MEYLLPLGLALSAVIAWSIGANDLANSISYAVGSGAARYRQALLLFIAGLLLGAVFQGHMVMKTLGKGVVEGIAVHEALSVSLAAFCWISLATYLGIPISTSQSITGAAIGVAVYRWLTGGRFEANLSVVYRIIASWVVSPLLAMLLSVLFYLLLYKAFPRSVDGPRLRWLILALSFFSAYAFGANDVANATGVYITVVAERLGFPELSAMRLLSLYSAVFILLGGLSFGRRVLETLAYRVTRLDVTMGAAAAIGNFLTVWLFTTIPYILFGFGMPISTTYACFGSIFGAGIARHKSFAGVSLRTVVVVVTAWTLTLPLTIAISTVVNVIFHELAYG